MGQLIFTSSMSRLQFEFSMGYVVDALVTILYNDGKVRVSCWVWYLGITFDSMMAGSLNSIMGKGKGVII